MVPPESSQFIFTCLTIAETVQGRISTRLLPSIGIRRLPAIRSRPANRGTKGSR